MSDEHSDRLPSAERIARLERRLQRERDARVEAERIAEEGMRSLYEANIHLDQRIAERTAELDEALAAAETAADKVRALLVGLSHSLATPLNGLRGMLELLEEVAADEPARSWHASATRSALRLDRLVQRLVRQVELDELDLRARLRPATARELLFEVEQRWRARLAAAGQLLVVDAGPRGEAQVGASEELSLVFDELLDNVRTHAAPGSVQVTTTPAAERSVVRIEIRDAGPETAPKPDEPHVDRLARSGDHGSQLGFVLVERIVTGLGGRFERDPDELGVVAVELPELSSA